MIYTELTKKAMKILYRAHQGQTDRSGIPYVFHPWHVAESMTDEYSTCAALLHDVLEDTEWTEDDLIREGFPEEVIRALRLLTHDPSVPYIDYVRAAGADPIARAVKLADLRHNSDLSRLDKVTEKDLARQKKYLSCIALLEEMAKTGS